MKVYDRLAEAFAAEGVTAIFGMMGSGNMHWLAALHQRGIPKYEVRHEGAGLGMADGWARVTQDVAVMTATEGPGVAQLATALVTASRASSPIVVFCGEYPMSDQEHPQRLDQSLFAAACESGFVHLVTADATDEAVRKAFYQARSESRPVLLSVPIDVQNLAFEDDAPYRPLRSMVPHDPVQPSPAQLEAAAALIAASRKPVVIVGRGAMWAPGTREPILRLAGRIGALVGTTLMAKNWLGEDEFHAGISGFYGTRTALGLFADSDCVIAVGASMNTFTTGHGYLYPNAKIVQIDAKPHLLTGHGMAADLYVRSDARLGVEALDALLAARSFSGTGFRTPEVREALRGAYADPERYEIPADLMDPREVCSVLDEAIPADVPLAIGTGSQAGFSALTFTRPRPYILAAHFFGCMGQMMPAAIGAIAATGKPVLLVDGDASVMMHMAEFETAVRYRWPLLIVVQNNAALGAEYFHLQAKGMDTALALVPCPDLGKVAEAFGGKGRLVRTAGELRAAAAEWVAHPEPMIIDARISPDVMPIPFRRTHLGKDA